MSDASYSRHKSSAGPLAAITSGHSGLRVGFLGLGHVVGQLASSLSLDVGLGEGASSGQGRPAQLHLAHRGPGEAENVLRVNWRR